MTSIDHEPAATATTADQEAMRKPLDHEIDVFGLTHQGKVRKTNQDNFLVATLHRRVDVKFSSLAQPVDNISGEERLAFIMMVADGVGGTEHGEAASRLAVESVSQYVTEAVRCYYGSGAASGAGNGEADFTSSLEQAARQCHESVCKHAEEQTIRSMATTLTLFLGMWPWIYILQVGDSRLYRLRNGELEQVTRDQTMAQELLDLGVMAPSEASRSRLSHVLSSAIGGQSSMPIVTRIAAEWHNVHLLCSDGLTRHVTDERIKEVLSTMTSAKQACETLLQEALDGGGSDNISVVIGRAVPAQEPAAA
jgi:protein phosphatase